MEIQPATPPDQLLEQPMRNRKPLTPTRMRSLTRLFMGGIEASLHDLLLRLDAWEGQVDQDTLSSSPQRNASDIVITYPPEPETGDEQPADLLRYAALGLLVEAQERTERGFHLLGRAGHLAYNVGDFFLRPLSNSRLVSPVRRRYEMLIQRGEKEVDRWVETGYAEDERGRALAQKALSDTINKSVDYVTADPEIRELVETQSASLANEVIEEVRERTFSADTYLEGIVRSLLQRTPRSALPGPSSVVRSRAAPLHPKITRSKRSGGKI